MSHPALKINHSEPYAAISPSRPELSQEGRTVLVTGGNSGIGFAIARGFIRASAKHVIIVSRRADVVVAAAKQLAQVAVTLGSPTTVTGIPCDISSLESVDSLWGRLKKQSIFVDVLVLNAASAGPAAPILQSGRDAVWADFETNVRSPLDLTERFYRQTGPGQGTKKVSYRTSKEFLLHKVG